MDNYTVLVYVTVGGEGLVSPGIELSLYGGDVYKAPLEGIVKFVGYRNKIRATTKYPPVYLYVHVIHKGDERIQNFRYLATEIMGIDLEKMLSVKLPGLPVYPRYKLIPHNSPVVVQIAHFKALNN
jgi:hypothetical protein